MKTSLIRFLAIVVASALGLGGSACSSSTAVTPQHLSALDGYRRGSPEATREVVGFDDETVEFDDFSSIELDLPNRHVSLSAPRQIDVTAGTMNVVTQRGEAMTIPLDTIQQADIERPAQLRTVLFIAGLLVGTVVVLAVRDFDPLGGMGQP